MSLSEIWSKHKKPIIIGLLVLAIVVVIVLLLKYEFKVFEKYTEGFEGYNPHYEKELKLFRSLSMSEQQEYLDLDKDSKISKYGQRLI